MGVAKQFWLMEQSLDDPPKKKSIDQLSPAAVRNRAGSNAKPPEGETTDPNDEEPDYDYAVFIVNEGGAVRMDIPYYPRKVTEHTPQKRSKPKRQNISEALREVIDDAQAITLNVEADFYQLIDPLSGAKKKLGESVVSVDARNRLTIKLKQNPTNELFYIRPARPFSFSGSSTSISWEQDQSHYKLVFEEEYDYETAYEQMNLWLNQRDDSAREKSDSGQEAEAPSPTPTTKSLQEEKKPKPASAPLKIADPPLIESSQLELAEISVTESPLSPVTPINPIPSVVIPPALLNTPETGSSISKSLFDDSDEEKNDSLEDSAGLKVLLAISNLTSSDILKFDETPYYRAIQSLKKISFLKSPRDKLGCILITFMDIIQCVTDFWESHGREPVVGADDLVPIFSYVILKARVPKLYSEMTFIWEFATDTEMKGKYGYGFATFQIGVEVVSRLTLDEMDRKKILETPISSQVKENAAAQTARAHEDRSEHEPTSTPDITDPTTSPGTTSPEDSFVDSPKPPPHNDSRATQSREGDGGTDNPEIHVSSPPEETELAVSEIIKKRATPEASGSDSEFEPK